ncbi:hypothetical protein JRQ81_016025, partial [Phrynocephalus forsythii]
CPPGVPNSGDSIGTQFCILGAKICSLFKLGSRFGPWCTGHNTVDWIEGHALGQMIDLGGNDLARMPAKELILKVIADLRAFNLQFPQNRLVWSALVPCLMWRSAPEPQQVDKACK